MSDYTPTGVPVADSAGASSEIRAEFVLIQTAIATKLESGGALGTPASGTLTNCTGLPVTTGISGLGTGVATALAVNVGSAGAPVVFNGALGTPSSGVATNLTGTAASLTAGTANAVPFIPTGTKMLFQQTNAPTGWTKDTTHNDKALRVVSGAASSGGTSAFSTVFGKTATDSHTLQTTEIPAHAHGVTDPTHAHNIAYSLGGAVGTWTTYGEGVAALTYGNATDAASTGISINNTGGGGGHTHGMDIRVQYVDLIIATRD